MKLGCRAAALVGSLAIVTVATSASGAADYPPELDAGADCTLWRGTVSGNDATVRMMFRLCPAAGDAVAGTAQWSSKVSGYNVRKLSGRWLDNGTRVELHDEAVIEQHPEPGWRFCKIDRYDLARNGDELTGTYDSRTCNDHATVKVSLVTNDTLVRPAGSPSSPPSSPPSEPATAAPAPVPSSLPMVTKPTSSSKACGCSCPGQPGVPGGGLVAIAAIAGALAVWRRR